MHFLGSKYISEMYLNLGIFQSKNLKSILKEERLFTEVCKFILLWKLIYLGSDGEEQVKK